MGWYFNRAKRVRLVFRGRFGWRPYEVSAPASYREKSFLEGATLPVEDGRKCGEQENESVAADGTVAEVIPTNPLNNHPKSSRGLGANGRVVVASDDGRASDEWTGAWE
jgi:hypothetical protein